MVSYEALVGDLPFGNGDTTEVAERIVHHNPRAPHQVAPVALPISQAVFKALAKQSDNRYLTASAFADYLARALSLGEAELFPSPPRLTLAAEYHAKGNDDAALKTIETLSAEGISHPEINELRERIDSSLRRKRIDEGIAAGRSLIEIREYDQASRELKRVIGEDPANSMAQAMLQEIDTRRTDQDVEELLRQTRRHMDEFDLDAARKALERVKKRRPREPRLSQFLAELDRIKAEYEELQGERQRLYDAVRSAYDRRDISAARSSIQKLAALDAAHPNIPNPRASEFGSLRSQVETEQEAIDVALAEVNALVSEKRLQEASRDLFGADRPISYERTFPAPPISNRAIASPRGSGCDPRNRGAASGRTRSHEAGEASGIENAAVSRRVSFQAATRTNEEVASGRRRDRLARKSLRGRKGIPRSSAGMAKTQDRLPALPHA